jgi:hypothetical protein
VPVEERKRQLARLLTGLRHSGVQLSDHVLGDGEIIFRKVCALGLEGIVSKRKGSSYRSGQSRDWLKSKNPASAAGGGRRLGTIRASVLQDLLYFGVQPVANVASMAGACRQQLAGFLGRLGFHTPFLGPHDLQVGVEHLQFRLS